MSTTTVCVDEYATMVGGITPKHQTLAFRPLSPTEVQLIGGEVHGATCPCCQRQRDDGRETLNELPTWSRRESYSEHQERQAAISSSKSTPYFEAKEGEFDEERDSQPGVLDSGVNYRPKRVLAEGIISKKGTGNDFFGNRSWKPRYCRLVLAKVDGFAVEVPLLLVYWFHSSDTPSTIISLDSTVVVPMDQLENGEGQYCFNIVYAKDEQKSTRTFTVPRKGRDAWVSAINQALYNYEKEKSKQKKSQVAAAKAKTPSKQFASKVKPPDIWSGDSFVEMTVSSPRSAMMCPPLSPRSPSKRPIPRPDVLMGKNLLQG